MKFIIAATLIAVAAGSALRTGGSCTLTNPNFNCFEGDNPVFSGEAVAWYRCCHGVKEGKDNFVQQSNIKKGCDGMASKIGGKVCCVKNKNGNGRHCVTHDDAKAKEDTYLKEQEGAGAKAAKAEKDKAADLAYDAAARKGRALDKASDADFKADAAHMKNRIVKPAFY